MQPDEQQMSDNGFMNDEPELGAPAKDQPAHEALIDADPAEAPDIAEGLAAGLQRELDHTGNPNPRADESSS